MQRLPITISMLLDLHTNLVNSSSDRAFWIVCIIAFVGFLHKCTLLTASWDLTLGKYIARSDIIDLSLKSSTVNIRFSKISTIRPACAFTPLILDSSHCVTKSPDALWHTGNVFRHQVYRGSAEAIFYFIITMHSTLGSIQLWIIPGVRLSAPGAP
jgi:hypothetical protein